jgi:hypothetical protein
VNNRPGHRRLAKPLGKLRGAIKGRHARHLAGPSPTVPKIAPRLRIHLLGIDT